MKNSLPGISYNEHTFYIFLKYMMSGLSAILAFFEIKLNRIITLMGNS